MTGTKERSFLFGTDASACAGPGKRFGFYLWNFGILILSAAGLCFLSLLLGIGTGGRVLLIDYLRHPLIFFLNFLPIFLFELLMFCLINRSWASFLATAVVFITASVGNYFKLEFRDDPFMFSDISAIHTALGVSSGYNITITRRIMPYLHRHRNAVYVLFRAWTCKRLFPHRRRNSYCSIRMASVDIRLLKRGYIQCKDREL